MSFSHDVTLDLIELGLFACASLIALLTVLGLGLSLLRDHVLQGNY
jgi:hypothetical protein